MAIAPKLAANLADGVYDVRDEVRLSLFLSRPEFASPKGRPPSFAGEAFAV